MTVWITGAANGIGKHLAFEFYKKDYNIIVSDIDIELLTSHFVDLDSKKVLYFKQDISKASEWQINLDKAVSKFQIIDILINTAAIIKPGFLHEISIEDIDNHMDINAKALMYSTKLISEHMVNNGSGHIINFSSLAGVAPIQGISLYSASKYAVRAFTLSIAKELKAKGIYITVICPDLVNTNMLTAQLDYSAAALTFSGDRILTVEDISEAIFETALKKKKIEILIPKYRGFLAKLGNFFPNFGFLLTDILTKKGLKKQAELNSKKK